MMAVNKTTSMSITTTRRALLRWGAAAGAAGVAGCSRMMVFDSTSPLQRTPGTNDWPSFHYDRTNTGHPQDYRMPTTSIDTAWTVDTGSRIDESVAVSEGRVFAANRGGQVYAINEKSGEVHWKTQISAGHSAPAVANNSVVLGTDNQGIVALDTATGEMQWSHQTDGSILSPPTIANGSVGTSSFVHSVENVHSIFSLVAEVS